MPHKRRRRKRNDILVHVVRVVHVVHGTWHLGALSVCTSVACPIEPVDSKLDKSKTTQYKSHNMANS